MQKNNDEVYRGAWLAAMEIPGHVATCSLCLRRDREPEPPLCEDLAMLQAAVTEASELEYARHGAHTVEIHEVVRSRQLAEALLGRQIHAPSCKWPEGEPCRVFSTDGTRTGAEIAHSFGTTDEEVIMRMKERADRQQLSDVAEEQADWEGERWDTSCPEWCVYQEEPHDECSVVKRRSRNGGGLMPGQEQHVPARDLHEPPPYPAGSLEWT